MKTSSFVDIRRNWQALNKEIPIYAETDLPELIDEVAVDECVFSYSDVPYQHVMTVGAICAAAGANFKIMEIRQTQLKGRKQLKDLEAAIHITKCDAVVVATPIDLGRLIKINQPRMRVHYSLQEIGSPNFDEILSGFCKKHKLTKRHRRPMERRLERRLSEFEEKLRT